LYFCLAAISQSNSFYCRNLLKKQILKPCTANNGGAAGRPPSGLRKQTVPKNSTGAIEDFRNSTSNAEDVLIMGDFDAEEVCALQIFLNVRISFTRV
jgi:hypothetical protein